MELGQRLVTMPAPASPLADATAAASVAGATVAGLTLNEWAALVAIIAGVYSIYDRAASRRRRLAACRDCEASAAD